MYNTNPSTPRKQIKTIVAVISISVLQSRMEVRRESCSKILYERGEDVGTRMITSFRQHLESRDKNGNLRNFSTTSYSP